MTDTLLVVASARQVERLGRRGRRAIARERLRAHLFEVASRDRLLASPIATRLVLADVLVRAAPREPVLLSSAREGGEAWGRTVDAIDASIGAIRRAGTTDEALTRVARDEAGAVGARARLLRDLIRALDAVLDVRGLVDPRAVGARLARAIASVPTSRIREAVGGSTVVARFLHDWDGDDAAWWRALDEALGKEGGSARVEVPTFDEDARIDAQRQSNPLDVVTDDVARALDAPPITVPIPPVLGDLRLEGPLPTRVSLCSASDADGQARAAVHAVLEAMASGFAVDAIAVGASALDDAALSALRLAFDRAQVPIEIIQGSDPLASRMVAFALRALAIGERGLARLEVASLLRSRYLDPGSLGTSSEALLDLARALERTPTVSASDARTTLGETARASSEDAATAAARAELGLRVSDALLLSSRPASRAAHAASARRLFRALGLEAVSTGAAERLLSSDRSGALGASPELRAVLRDARAWAVLDAALTDFERAARQLGLEGSTIPPLAFRHEIVVAAGARPELPSTSAAAIAVGTLEHLAGEELDLLVVIDANEGALPSGSDEDAALAESIGPALRRVDPSRAPASFATRSARSLAALAAAASGARRVVLIRRARDEEGAAVAPSPIFAWLERGGVPAVAWRASPLDGSATNAREVDLRRAARAGGDDGGDGGDAARRARIERTRESRFEWTTAPRDPVLGDLDLVPALDPRLLQALSAETGGGERPLAVTSLERFASCPFQGFAQQVLRARKTRPLREVPDARESGTLLHRALAAAFRESAAAWRERPRDAARIRAEALAACDGVLREESAASSLRRLAVARIREAVVATLEWSLADDAWDFAHAERAFGDSRARDGAWPPLVLVDGETRLALGGSIDRVDTGHGRAAVRAIDYKLSRSAAERAMRGFGDTAFQVALYAHAAAEALGLTERAGAYVAAGRPDAVGPKLRKDYEAKWASLHVGGGALTPLETKAVEVVRSVRLGVVAPRPFDEATCTSCDSSGACRKPRFAVARDDEGAA